MNTKQRNVLREKTIKINFKKTCTVKIYPNCKRQYIKYGDGIQVILE